MGSDGRLLLLLQQIRDEAHRFAVTFQRKQRGRTMVNSALDRVAGVGTQRKTMLIKHFGGMKKIRAATVDELSALPGINQAMAEAIKRALS
jgi:excinuclease ABC subunit C